MATNQKYIPALKFHWLTKIYDWLIGTFMPEKAFKAALLHNAEIKNNYQVLDFGVGTATLSIMAYNNNNQATYQGIDIDDKILAIAKQKIEREDLPINLVKYNGGVLPFDAYSMDRVISSLVIHHLTDEQKVEAFKEFKRVLKPSGEVHIADWSKPTSFIMRLCFHLVQFLDGYKTTSANVKGKLPEIIKSTGFSQVEITHNFNSVLGTVGIFKIIQLKNEINKMVIQNIIQKKLLQVTIALLISNTVTAQKVIHYDLTIKDSLVNFTGKTKRAIAVNGQIPMPTLVFTEGDTAEIVVHNELNESTSLHWHGLILPNKEDGVPYLTQMPIKPHTTHTYRFPIVQNGTHWYHSHSGLQEQIGMYGNFIMLKKPDDKTFRKGIDDLPTIPIVLSEWTDYNPNNIHRMLHNATDWFAIKKNAVQSYAEAIKAKHFKTKLRNEWKRMLAMDVSDVYYDKIFMNGKPSTDLKSIDGSELKAGDKVRLRISNGGASSYFWLTYAGGKITVVANDGNDVVPVEVDRLIIAVSETYDIIVTIPADNTAYEFLATTEDRTNSASFYIGNGIKQTKSPQPRLKYFEGMKMMNDMMKMNGRLDDMGMQMSLNQMDMNVVMYPEITGDSKPKQNDNDPNRYNANALADIVTLNYAMLKSPYNTTLPKEAPVKTLQFELTGNMNRYVWSMDNKVVSETDKILIKKGENVRIVLYNGSMMRHPMHLHGHDFRLLNGQGENAPLKNIVDIMPMETDTLEFNANMEGDWFFHCHILYHMMSGMGRVFTYENQAPNPYIPNPKYAWRKLKGEDKKLHFMGENDFATNGNDGMAMLQNTRWSMGSEWRLGYNDMHGYEVETHLGRYIGRMQWFMPFIGFDWRYRKMGIDEQEKNIFGQTNTKDNRAVVSLGFEYTLPMMVKWQAEVFTDGIFRMQLMREDIPIAKRLRMGFMVNTDKEYMLDLRYIVNKNMGIRTHYDSDMGFGIGINLNY